MAGNMAEQGSRRGWFGQQAVKRRGKNQRQVWRMLVAYDRPVSTAEMLAAVYPRLRKADRDHYWYAVRCAAERYAVRVEPRTRPLKWIAKPELLAGKKG